MKSINEKFKADYHAVFVHAEREVYVPVRTIPRFSFSSGDLHSIYENMIDFFNTCQVSGNQENENVGASKFV